MIRGLVYFTGFITLVVLGAVAAVAFRVDRWPWRNYAETGRQYLVEKLEEAEFEDADGTRELAPGAGIDSGARPAVYVEPQGAPLAIRHTVQRGETLYRIAGRYYGNPDKWRLIANANGISKPSDLRVGMTLLIPVARSIAQRERRAWPEPRLAMTPAFTLENADRSAADDAGREEGDTP